MDLQFTLPNAAATQTFGQWLGERLPAGSNLLLFGGLGAGKTTFTQGLGAGLAIPEPIVSPTFALLNEYLDGRLPLYHFDLYRLDPPEVDTLAPDLYWEGREVAPGIVAIEWSQRLPFRPNRYLEIHLQATEADRRTVRLHNVGGIPAELGQAIATHFGS